MHAQAAWLWLLLPPALVWVWWLSRRSYAQLRPWARYTSAALRAAILLLLIAALSRTVWTRRTSGQHAVFLLDVSRSVSRENLDAAVTDIDRLAAENAAAGNTVSLIVFGRGARQLVPPARAWSPLSQDQLDTLFHEQRATELKSQLAALVAADSAGPRAELQRRIRAVETFRAEVVGEHTDAAGAVRLALNSGDVGEAKALILLSDANFNRGSWSDALAAVRSAGHSLNLVALDRPIPPEIAAADLTIPQSVRVNQGFSADLRIASTVETTAQIAVFRDGFAAGEFTQPLKPGDNRVRIPSLYFREKGFHTVEVAVRAKDDTRLENNRVRAMVTVPGELRVLYVDADEPQQTYLASALALEGIQVHKRPASGVPRSLDDLLGFDAFILSNVPADKLSMPQMQMIRSYVQDFGGGFVMLGGDQSFGLGGYYGTPVEEVLPIRMPIQKDLNRPSLA
ncbi:MAG TPA: hypothetical protein VFF65_07225, partial [Phycisphaerales bacterium]|nr:hypothetical protein [Phycisphaerales bacterium]